MRQEFPFPKGRDHKGLSLTKDSIKFNTPTPLQEISKKPLPFAPCFGGLHSFLCLINYLQGSRKTREGCDLDGEPGAPTTFRFFLSNPPTRKISSAHTLASSGLLHLSTRSNFSFLPTRTSSLVPNIPCKSTRKYQG